MIYRLILLLAATILMTGCGSQENSTKTSTDPIKTQQSDLTRETPAVDTAELTTLRNGLGDFSFELYRELNTSGENLFYSPFSIGSVFTMLYAGASGDTKTQLRNAFHFLDNDTLHHQTYNALGLSVFDGEGNLTSADSIWLQQNMAVKQDFLDTLSLNYGADVKTVDFVANPEVARVAINNWVSKQTYGLIPETLNKGSVNEMTRLVLVNTIYFLGRWLNVFSPETTDQAAFHLRNGTETTVAMMHQTKNHLYYRGNNLSVISRSYDDLQQKMVIILPDAGSFDSVENNLSRENLETILERMSTKTVTLSLPKFEIETSYNLSEKLKALGITDAFDDSLADFSGISDTSLFISFVIHKAVIKLDEEGTEAAAVTATGMATTALPQEYDEVTMTIDRPFFFFIMNSDNTILFMGKVENPNG